MISARLNNLNVAFASYSELLSIVSGVFSAPGEQICIGYVNTNSVVLSSELPKFFLSLQAFSLLYADGFGMHAAARILGNKTDGLLENNNATEFNHALLAFLHDHRQKVFLLGTTPVSLQRFAERSSVQYPNIKIVGTCDGFHGASDPGTLASINRSGADVLLVGMGSPQQEMWVHEHFDELNVPICVTVGAFLDFYSGTIRRAPAVVRFLRLEWLFRLLQEPVRLWRRYLIGIPKFLILIFKQRVSR